MNNFIFAPFRRAAEGALATINNLMKREAEETISDKSKDLFARAIPIEILELIFSFIPDNALLTCLSLNRSWNRYIEEDKMFKPIIATERVKNFLENNSGDFYIATNKPISDAQLFGMQIRSFIWHESNWGAADTRSFALPFTLAHVDDELAKFFQENKEKDNYKHMLLDFVVQLIANRVFVQKVNKMNKFPLYYKHKNNRISSCEQCFQILGTSDFSIKFTSMLDKYIEFGLFCVKNPLPKAPEGNMGSLPFQTAEEKYTKVNKERFAANKEKCVETVEWFLKQGYVENAINISKYHYNHHHTTIRIGGTTSAVRIINHFVKIGEIDKVQKGLSKFDFTDNYRDEQLLLEPFADALIEKYYYNNFVMSHLASLKNDFYALQGIINMDFIALTEQGERKGQADADSWFRFGNM